MGLAAGVAVEVILFVASMGFDPNATLVATLLLGPLIAGLLAGPRETALLLVLALVLAVVSGIWHDGFEMGSYWIRLAVLAIGGTLVTLGAGARVRTAATLRRFELLAAIGDVADGSLTLRETVDRVLDLIVPVFADLCVLDGGTDAANLRRLGARADTPDRAAVEEALLRRRLVRDAPIGSLNVARTERSQLLAPLGDEHIRMIASDEADAELLRSLGLTCALFVPLRSRGRMIGTLGWAMGRSGRGLDDSDVRFVEVLSGRIALALDNAGLSAEVTSLERRLDATLTNLAEAVTVQDRDGRTIFANRAAAELLQIESPAELIAAEPGDVLERFVVTREDGTPVGLPDLPGARALAGETPEPLLVRNVVRATGEERWLVNKATPVPAADGGVDMVVNVIQDVTEVKRAEFAQRLLAQAGELLSSSLDYETTLQQVARLAVPELADWCGVSLPDAGGVLRSVAVAHTDPAKVAFARRLGEAYPARMSDEGGAAEVMRTGESQLVNEIPDEMLAEAALDEEHLDLLQTLQMRSALLVPLTTGRETLGVLTLIEAESARVFDEGDRALAEELGRRAAIAVSNALLYTERSQIAETLQRSLLPPALPQLPGWEVESLYRAAGAQNEVGGDFYDVFEIPSGWMAVVGDVAGRGAEAAALTSLARYTVRTAAELLDDPVAAVDRLNAALRERQELSLVSVCCAVLRERDGAAEAEIVCAGHPLPYLVRHGEGAQQVGAFGPFLGAIEDAGWRAVRVPIEAGDHLILYTDGVIDTVGEHERFGEERLGSVIAEVTGARDAVARIDAALGAFESGAQRDDTAVLALARSGVARGGAPVHERFSIQGGTGAPRAVRQRVRPHVERHLGVEAVYDVELLVGELIANAVRHGGGDDSATLEVEFRVDDGLLRFEVTDPGPGFVRPDRPRAREGNGGGHGFVIIEKLADAWGVETDPHTRVWFDYRAPRG